MAHAMRSNGVPLLRTLVDESVLVSKGYIDPAPLVQAGWKVPVRGLYEVLALELSLRALRH